MKPCYLFLTLALFSVSQLYSQSIEADIRVFGFETLNDEFIAEFYIGVISKSIKQIENQSIKGVNVKLLVKQGEEIVQADKYELTQPVTAAKDFYDLQRILLKPGQYEFDVVLTDLADPSNSIRRSINSSFEASTSDRITLSSIQLLGNLSKVEEKNPKAKNGFVMEPLKFQFLNSNYKHFRAYTEAYRTDTHFEGDYILRYDIIHDGGSKRDTVLTRFKRRKAQTIDPILITEVNDTTWKSGKYIFSLAVMDFDQNLRAAGRTDFILSNRRESGRADAEGSIEDSFVADLNDEELNYALRALAP